MGVYILENELFEIIADTVTVEIKDAATGQIYRRELPIDYYENANFLRLSGENLDGSLSQLVFYTPRGIERLMEESQLDELVVTDSIALREGFETKKLPFKFTVLSVAPLIGEAIRRIHEDESVNSLFKDTGHR